MPTEDRALRAREPRRHDPHRHQEARAASSVSAIASPAIAPDSRTAAASAGSSSMSPSTTPRALPSRMIMPDEKRRAPSPSSRRRVAYYASLGITVERVMTDNGSCYRLEGAFQSLPRRGIRHIRTRPYTPAPTARPNASSRPRSRMGLRPTLPDLRPPSRRNCPNWLHPPYNWHGLTAALKSKTPVSDSASTQPPEDNLLRLHKARRHAALKPISLAAKRLGSSRAFPLA
jgi:hypothetical protein